MIHGKLVFLKLMVIVALAGCSNLSGQDVSGEPVPEFDRPSSSQNERTSEAQSGDKPMATSEDQSDVKLATATFGAGCFWCTEAVFQQVEGVESVTSGYSGGRVENPTYEQVCSKKTGHAEVVQITYDPNIVSYKELLEIFWKTHDPTTPNRQGNDVGPQYRSVIFYHDDEQRQLAAKYKKKLDESGAFKDPIVTEISECEKFYPAEDYHQNYYKLNPRQGYCAFVIAPKLKKFKAAFAEKLKDESQP